MDQPPPNPRFLPREARDLEFVNSTRMRYEKDAAPFGPHACTHFSRIPHEDNLGNLRLRSAESLLKKSPPWDFFNRSILRPRHTGRGLRVAPRSCASLHSARTPSGRPRDVLKGVIQH